MRNASIVTHLDSSLTNSTRVNVVRANVSVLTITAENATSFKDSDAGAEPLIVGEELNGPKRFDHIRLHVLIAFVCPKTCSQVF